VDQSADQLRRETAQRAPRAQRTVFVGIPRRDRHIDGDGANDWITQSRTSTSTANAANRMSAFIWCLNKGPAGGIAQFAGEVIRVSNVAAINNISKLQVL